MNPTEGVKGMQGYWHATDGSFDKSGNKLNVLCGTSISPMHRKLKHNVAINCPHCLEIALRKKSYKITLAETGVSNE